MTVEQLQERRREQDRIDRVSIADLWGSLGVAVEDDCAA